MDVCGREIRVEGGSLKAFPAHEVDRMEMTPSTRPFAAIGFLSFWLGALSPADAAPPLEIGTSMPKDPLLSARPANFATKDEAEAFLATALPQATAANPKYRSKDGGLTQWLTKEVVFGPGASGQGISVTMKEDMLEFRNGRQTAAGSHEVRFLIEDVQISELTDSPDRTENGEKALGVLFRCNAGKCINAKWNGVPTPSEQSDISIQDNATRAKILAAFQALKRFAGDRAGAKR